MSGIEEEHESSSALHCILFELFLGYVMDSLLHSALVSILVALDLVSGETILLDALLKFVSPLSCKRHVSIL